MAFANRGLRVGWGALVVLVCLASLQVYWTQSHALLQDLHPLYLMRARANQRGDR